MLPADSNNDPSTWLVASTAGVPHVVSHTSPGQEVQRARGVVHRGVGIVSEAGDVLLQYEAIPGPGGGRGWPRVETLGTGASRQCCTGYTADSHLERRGEVRSASTPLVLLLTLVNTEDCNESPDKFSPPPDCRHHLTGIYRLTQTLFSSQLRTLLEFIFMGQVFMSL